MEYAHHDAVGLAQMLRDREVTAGELLDAARARAAQVNPTLNAVIHDFAPAISRDVPDAPFAGVPFLLKDLGQHVAGHPTSNGSRALMDVPRAETSRVVERWLDAGLVVFGKTNTPEFGSKGITEPVAFGPARNPWNTEHTPGGSSGGSAAAVAAGIVPCAGANDGGGSIRIPASACGLFGLKPSRGLVPAGPEVGESGIGTSTHGVISRSVRDTAAMLDVIVGASDESPYLPAVPSSPYADELGRDAGRLRVALCTDSAINPDPHPEAIAAVRATAELLTELGHDVVELDSQPVDDAALSRDFLTTWFAKAAIEMAGAKALSGANDSSFEDDTRLMAAIGRQTRAPRVLQAIENRHTHTRRLAEFHATHDFLLTPMTATPPPRIGALELPEKLRTAQSVLVKARAASVLRFTSVIDDAVREQLGWIPYAQLANLTGRPAMSVPLHWTADGLPIGSQFVGRLGSEPTLLRLAAQLEEARPWAERRPTI